MISKKKQPRKLRSGVESRRVFWEHALSRQQEHGVNWSKKIQLARSVMDKASLALASFAFESSKLSDPLAPEVQGAPEPWESWRGRAAQNLGDSAVKARAHAMERSRGPSAWGRSLMGGVLGFLLGYPISLALVGLSKSKERERLIDMVVERKWSIQMAMEAGLIKKREREQAKARLDPTSPLPSFQVHDWSSRPKWKRTLLTVADILAFGLLAPLAWMWALGSQPRIARKAWGEIAAGLQRAKHELELADAPEQAQEAWLGACRWFDLAGSPSAHSKIHALACCAGSEPGLSGLVRDVDAGWRRAGRVPNEAGRRQEMEEGLAGLAPSLIMGTALSEAKSLPDAQRRVAASAAFAELSRAWRRSDSGYGKLESWRWTELAQSAALLLCEKSFARALDLQEFSMEEPGAGPVSKDEAVDPWAYLQRQSDLAKADCQGQAWPRALREAVLSRLVQAAALLALRQKRAVSAISFDPVAGKLDEASSKGFETWASKAAASMGWGLGPLALARAMCDGLARDPDWGAKFAWALGAQSILAEMELCCQRAATEWEAGEIGAMVKDPAAESKAKRL